MNLEISQEAASTKKKRPARKKAEPRPQAEAEKKIELLDGRDRKVMEAALERLWDELDNVSDEFLPKVFIYSDTAARPLAYGVKPLMEAYYSSRGLKAPEHRYLSTPPTSEIDNFSFHQAKEIMEGIYADRDWKMKLLINKFASSKNFQEYMDVQEKLKGDLSDEEKGMATRILKRIEEGVQRKMQESPAQMKEIQEIETSLGKIETIKDRVTEILDSLPEKGDVMIIDDYFLDGRTYSVLQSIFERMKKDGAEVHWKLFAFFKNTEIRKWGNKRDEIPTLSWGCDNALTGPRYTGFRYRDVKAESTGVVKQGGEAYSKRAGEADLGLMKRLRAEIGAIEERVVVKKMREKINREKGN